jgi:hypothetical protein
MMRITLVFSYFRNPLVVDALQTKADTSRHTEEAVMSVAARKIEVEHKMNQRSALDEKVDHIQSDLTELKADVKRIEVRLDGRVDAVEEKVDAVAASLAEHRVETEKSFGKVREEISSLRTDLTKDVNTLRNDLTKEVGSLRVEIKDVVAALRHERIVFIAWAVGILIAAVGAFSTFLAPQPPPSAREGPAQESADAPQPNEPR